ncbi:protein with phosphotransacetylase biod-like n-terminal domain protein [Halogranum salarium B-1]|uniref:Protein with phosphotransacetylase biod-like n-terminal domain protein n=2 Tax=Halogranum rubrum TaxID=553466 RepID=J3JGJ2_9EURY|nr:protein with phosphotransacetylase biod-like n-terminal domain protein [Halogranum salarium B-1]
MTLPDNDSAMNTLLVTSTQDSTGKTAVTLALGLLAQERGLDVGYMKPKGTRLQSNVGKTLDQDPMLARELLGLDAEMHQMEPIVYSPTFVEGAIRGQEDGDELADIVRENYDQLSAGKDLMLIEGAGRYTTGGIIDLTDPEVAELLDAQVLLVADYTKPGDIDDVLAAADDIGEDLAGVLFNRVSDSVYDELETEVVPFLENRGIDVLGVLPRKRELAGVTVEGLAQELGADVATNVPTDAFVERFLVGAMGGDAALRYFRRTKDAAVITGGDRSEIHTAALEAPGVKALILTGGHRPPAAVLGKAEEKGVPVLLVNADTLSVVDRAEELVHSGRTRDEETVSLLRDLLFEHADVDALVPAAADDE